MPQACDLFPFELTGSSLQCGECLSGVERAGADDRGVLLTAERGLDAEAVARAVHMRSARQDRPFVPVSCDGTAAADLDRALFGPRPKVATTDAEWAAPGGALLRAVGGTLFLGSLQELPAPLQRRLARVVRDGEVRLPRRQLPVALDVRVIGARESSVDGGVREELARRLPIVIDIPPLRARREDVPAIAQAMLHARDADRRFTPAALNVLAALRWSGNTAELAELVERLAASAGGGPIRQEDVLGEVHLERAPLAAAASLRDARRQFEREYIAAVLREHGWQMPRAARALGIERANLYRKARQLGIPLRREAEVAARRVSR